jgi:hypothetical protein
MKMELKIILEDKMEKIYLTEVLNKARNLRDKKINETEYKGFLEKIIIYNYIPLITKTKLIMGLSVYKTMFSDGYPEFVAAEVEKLKVFGLLLAYTNILIEEDENTYENYDDFILFGFYDLIKDRVEQDYNRLEKMFDNFVSTSNLLAVGSKLALLDTESLQQNTDTINELIKGLDNDKLENLMNLFIGTDPKFKSFVEKEATETIKKKEKQEEL